MIATRSSEPDPRLKGHLTDKPGSRVDVALTLPIFLSYHAGVVFLHVKNASDLVTEALLRLAEGNRAMYLLITAAIGVVFAGLALWRGKNDVFSLRKFAQIALEGVIYAIAMRFLAEYVVGELFAGNVEAPDLFTGVVMSLGAGFYEELAFRVILFGLGAKLLLWVLARSEGSSSSERRYAPVRIVLLVVWALVAAMLFSVAHYVGTLADPFALPSFVFRVVIGVALTLIYRMRGFAAAVWSHALYDVWVLA